MRTNGIKLLEVAHVTFPGLQTPAVQTTYREQNYFHAGLMVSPPMVRKLCLIKKNKIDLESSKFSKAYSGVPLEGFPQIVRDFQKSYP